MKLADALNQIRPEGGWIAYGDDLANVQWISGEPVTQQEVDHAFSELDKLEQEKMKRRETVLAALAAAAGLDVDEVKAALGA